MVLFPKTPDEDINRLINDYLIRQLWQQQNYTLCQKQKK